MMSSFLPPWIYSLPVLLLLTRPEAVAPLRPNTLLPDQIKHCSRNRYGDQQRLSYVTLEEMLLQWGKGKGSRRGEEEQTFGCKPAKQCQSYGSVPKPSKPPRWLLSTQQCSKQLFTHNLKQLNYSQASLLTKKQLQATTVVSSYQKVSLKQH